MSTINQVRRQPVAMIHQVSDADYLTALERRLADGYARIEEARSRGQDVTDWEAFWIELLHEYEMAVDDLPEAA